MLVFWVMLRGRCSTRQSEGGVLTDVRVSHGDVSNDSESIALAQQSLVEGPMKQWPRFLLLNGCGLACRAA